MPRQCVSCHCSKVWRIRRSLGVLEELQYHAARILWVRDKTAGLSRDTGLPECNMSRTALWIDSALQTTCKPKTYLVLQEEPRRTTTATHPSSIIRFPWTHSNTTQLTASPPSQYQKVLSQLVNCKKDYSFKKRSKLSNSWILALVFTTKTWCPRRCPRPAPVLHARVARPPGWLPTPTTPCRQRRSRHPTASRPPSWPQDRNSLASKMEVEYGSIMVNPHSKSNENLKVSFTIEWFHTSTISSLLFWEEGLPKVGVSKYL